MTLPITFAAFAACVAVAVLCGWLGARPPNLQKGPRLFPYRMVMTLAGAGALLFLVHLVNLAGVTTGRG